MTLAEELCVLREAVRDFRNVFVWHLPGWVHRVILHWTGYRVVRIVDLLPYGEEELVGYEWTDEYPLKNGAWGQDLCAKVPDERRD